MESFYAEFSKIIGYTFYIKFSPGSETKIMITPTPNILYFQICGKVFGINLITPIASLNDIVYNQENEWLYIKIPSTLPTEVDLRFKREFTQEIQNILCKKCRKSLASGFEKSYPMPSTN